MQQLNPDLGSQIWRHANREEILRLGARKSKGPVAPQIVSRGAAVCSVVSPAALSWPDHVVPHVAESVCHSADMTVLGMRHNPTLVLNPDDDGSMSWAAGHTISP
jgi:hypothetical protein